MSGYIGVQPVPQATQTRDVFTATAGQTSFATSGYTPGFLDVYLNGVHLVNGTDYTASNGSDVVLSSGATAGDNLEVVAYTTFQTGDFVPTSGGTFAGSVAVNGNLTVDTNTLFVDATNNNVGIRTATPIAPLHVSYSNTSFAAGLRVQNTATTGNNWGRIDLRSASASNDFVLAQLPNEDAQVNLIGNGNLLFATNNLERVRVDSSGNLLVGTSTPLGAKQVNLWNSVTESGLLLKTSQTTFNGSAIVFYNSSNGLSGFIGQTASSVSYNTSSDYRLKEDVQPLSGASNRVLALKPVNFAWKIDGTRVDGFIAHEAQAIVPEAVTGKKDAVDADGNPVYQGIDQSKLVPLLTAALQEALADIATLKAEVAALKGEPA